MTDPVRFIPEGVVPTPSEWVDRFLMLPREQQEAIAAGVQDNADRAHRCFVMDHEGAIEQLTVLQDQLNQVTFESLKAGSERSRW